MACLPLWTSGKIGVHGCSHENPISMTPEQEEAVLDRCIGLVAEVAGTPPAGYVKIERGRDVYMQYCTACHGYPDSDSDGWVKGERQGEVVPHEELETDPERVTFRYYDVVADDIYDHFPGGHPLRPPRESLRPGPLGTTRGYINAPLESVFTRAPYLHNASALTMAELLNLKPRRDVFYRGDNMYDPEDMGLISPSQPDDSHYYEFDTTKQGNSNKGHDYPWPYRGPGWDADALEDLLEYLKAF